MQHRQLTEEATVGYGMAEVRGSYLDLKEAWFALADALGPQSNRFSGLMFAEGGVPNAILQADTKAIEQWKTDVSGAVHTMVKATANCLFDMSHMYEGEYASERREKLQDQVKKLRSALVAKWPQAWSTSVVLLRRAKSATEEAIKVITPEWQPQGVLEDAFTKRREEK
jgi:hypothetical protein